MSLRKKIARKFCSGKMCVILGTQCAHASRNESKMIFKIRNLSNHAQLIKVSKLTLVVYAKTWPVALA